MKWVGRILPGALVLTALAIGGWILRASHGGEQAAPSAASVTAGNLRDPALVARGRYLTTVGDCMACHTAQGGLPYAGGRSVPTPFGAVPAPNLTPDRATGIGQWSFADFWRALHAGRGRQGELLYPAFPYTSYTRVTRDDALAMFAYLLTLAPVHAPPGVSGLDFPYSMRGSLAAWRAMYFNEGGYRPEPARSQAWNRGAYLVQGLGHCNECHAARDALGGVSGHPALTGGRIPELDWYAPDLSTRAGGGLQGWSEQDIIDLLQTGRSAKGVAFGPMADVVADSTQYMSGDDLRAIATYLHALPPRAQPAQAMSQFDARALVQQGGKVYGQHCADCHGKDGAGVAGIYPPLDGNSAVTEPTGINATRMVLLGGFAPLTRANPRPYSMPPFAQQLSDGEVSAVVSYIRRAWTNRAPVVRPGDVSRYRHTPID
ncbi:MAG: cytochrome c [Xanthomonadaceae bacterium]|nr:cytochrome c [Xanthomonadaceae bacterium]